jgi:hypothetical protein
VHIDFYAIRRSPQSQKKYLLVNGERRKTKDF